jgi:hypothetical protein
MRYNLHNIPGKRFGPEYFPHGLASCGGSRIFDKMAGDRIPYLRGMICIYSGIDDRLVFLFLPDDYTIISVQSDIVYENLQEHLNGEDFRRSQDEVCNFILDLLAQTYELTEVDF